MLNEVVTVTLTDDGPNARCDVSVDGSQLALGGHANEFFMALFVVHSRQLTGTAFRPSRVWFAHPRPADMRALIDLFQTTTIAFDRPTNGFEIPREHLEARMLSADPALLSALDNHAETLLKAHRGPPGFLAEVQRTVREALTDGAPTLGEVAERLGTRPRTLQRRLAEAGTSFQRLVDTVREELARMYLAERTPLDQVAYLLGYAEMAAFRRAFKRWTGRTPRSWTG